jgi:arylsulfatase B
VLPGGGQGRLANNNLILSTHMGHYEPPYDANNPILRDGQPVEESQYLTDAFAREAVDFIRRRAAQPFFLCVAFNAVHSPLQASDRFMRQFASIEDVHRRIFAGMLANMDEAVGAILATLRDHDLEDNTIVFFISDNGGPTRELTSSNAPLRGGKGDVYEGGIRVPFLVRWKGPLPAGKVFSHPVSSLDIFATAAALAGKPIATQDAVDGVNLMPFLTGSNQQPPHDVLFWRMQRKTAIRHGDWKLVKNPGWGRKDAPWELYQLAEDSGESHDLAKERPERVRALRRKWEDLNSQMAEPFWSPGRAPGVR